jgi:hypothetical protein
VSVLSVPYGLGTDGKDRPQDESERMCETNPMVLWVNCADRTFQRWGRRTRAAMCEKNPMALWIDCADLATSLLGRKGTMECAKQTQWHPGWITPTLRAWPWTGAGTP